MDQAMHSEERWYWLGQVSISELRNEIELVEQAQKHQALAVYSSTDIAVLKINVEERELRDGGAIVGIAIGWIGSRIAEKLFDVIVDDLIRPRLRERCHGRDLGEPINPQGEIDGSHDPVD